MVTKVQRYQLFKGYSSQNNNKEIMYDVEIVKQDLLNHFHTRIGERVMMPTYGCIIWDLLGEPFTDDVRDDIIINVREILESDSRVEFDEVIVEEFEHGIIVRANIFYKPFEVLESFAVKFDERNLDVSNIKR